MNEYERWRVGLQILQIFATLLAPALVYLMVRNNGGCRVCKRPDLKDKKAK